MIEELDHLRDETMRRTAPILGVEHMTPTFARETGADRQLTLACQDCLHGETCPGAPVAFLDNDGEAALRPVKAVRANSFNFELQPWLVAANRLSGKPFSIRQHDCSARSLELDEPPLRWVILASEEPNAEITLYHTPTSDFTDAAIREVKDKLERLVERVRLIAGDSAEPLCVVIGVTMFSDLNRSWETLVPRTAAALARALPEASLGLADLYVCGMNYFPFDPCRALRDNPGVDWVLTGEAEPTLPELIRRLESGEPVAGLPRLAWRELDGNLGHNPEPPEPFEDLDRLPLPAFDLLDMDHYFGVQAGAIEADLVHEYHVVERQLPLMTSRSCPHRCSFCTNQVLGLPWRAHSVDYVRDALRTLRERYRVDRFLLLDDNINRDRDRFRRLVRMLADEGVPWDAVNGFRADHLDRGTVRDIAAAGNTKITVSAESGDPELLRKVIGKGLSLGAVTRLAKVCQDERIPLQVHYIVGVPGETKTQINRTLEHATELLERHGAWPLLQHAIPFPGTRLWRDCEERGWFVAPPETISGAVLEVESIIRTPDFDPAEVIAMKRGAQHLHAAIQSLTLLEVETECDLECLACHCRHDGAASAPDRDELRRRLEQARFLGGRELFLSGGEPTLRRDLPEIIAESRALGFERVTLVTNAHGLARDDRVRAILGAGVDRLAVDLLGPRAEVHDALARKDGAFRWTLAGVAKARQLGCPGLEVHIPITRPALEHLAATVRLALRLGADAVHLQLPQPDSRAMGEGYIPTWVEAEPHLLRALASAPAGVVSVQGAPLCLWPRHPGGLVPLPPWELRRARPHRVRHPRCLECVLYLLCGGFFRPEHERVYGAMSREP